MEKITQYLDDQLLLYLDGELSEVERKKLEEELSGNEALRSRLDELSTVHLLLQNSKLEHPSKNFTQLVMGKLDQYPAQSKNLSMRNGIFLLLGVLVAVGIATVFVSSGVFDDTATVDLNQVNIPKKYFEKTLPTILFNGKLIVNIIIVLNLGLAWLVLDRAILKPFFQRRMQTGH